MLKNNEIYTVTFTDYTAEGLGVCRAEGCVVFVPNAIVGETCTVRITKVGKQVAYGKLEQILTRSPHRVARECAYCKLCGGCAFWHMDYTEELRLKADRVTQCLNRLGGATLAQVPILGGETHGYRNKAQYPVGEARGKPVAGFYKARTHEVVPIDRCLIQDESADAAKAAVLSYMQQYHVKPYEEKTHSGLVRHIYVRRGFGTGQVLVCIVICGERLPHEQALIAQLLQRVPGLKSVVLSLHAGDGNVVLGQRFRTLLGDGTIEDTLCSLRFRLSARSFYQVNRTQAERLYEKALEKAGLTGTQTVLELYCGIGTITLCLAKRCRRVVGVEIVEAAIADAKENARRNGIENAEFFCEDAAAAAARFAREGAKPDVIVVDPPRKGLAADVIDAIAEMVPQRLVYVSCDPATLARDVRLLSARGYRLADAEAVDLFPRCAHVETVCLLLREGN